MKPPIHAFADALALGREAAAVGFDWPALAGVFDKVAEEHAELLEAVAGGDPAAIESELGDLLFALASVARHLDLDPERALAGASARFRARFAAIEASLTADGLTWDDLTLDEMEARWQRAKELTPRR